MLRQRLLLLMMLSLTASCQSSTVLIDSACSWIKPISTSAKDREVLSTLTKREIVVHNELYKSHCLIKKE